ncbi:MAG TPA: hypothetical protein VGN76_11460 [Gemmatimonadales bacterium]|jgi:hypothetical protein|nr:hypothetical protein [Gemmatimonadales bacterium]
MLGISVADRRRRAWLAAVSTVSVGLLIAAGIRRPIPSTFLFEVDARPELHQLWETSSQAKAERVACLAATIDSDTVHISRVRPLAPGRADSLGISAGASLDQCGPPEWRGTVHTHVALRDGQRPYSLFSGADRGVMMIWWRRWQVDGVFCLLYSSEEVICEIEGPQGAVLFPRSRY